MTSQQSIEIGFWRDLLRSKGNVENFVEQRKDDWVDMAANLPELLEYLEKGSKMKVLEVGCGLISPLEFAASKAEITAIDPLVGAYQDTIDLIGRPVRYLEQSGEAIAFEDGTFDAVTCLNVLDHTPNPDTMVTEIRRVLKTGGKLFFEINYDPALSPAHYGLWNDECVAAALKDFTLIASRKDERPDYGQARYWAVYQK